MLKRLRRITDLEQALWRYRFDLDGALSAGQYELAWSSRDQLLIRGLELYLRSSGVGLPVAPDSVQHVCTLMRHLLVIDAAAAAVWWHLLVRDVPSEEATLRQETDESLAFLRDRLGVRAAASRGEAILQWAEGMRRMRDVGQALGVVHGCLGDVEINP